MRREKEAESVDKEEVDIFAKVENEKRFLFLKENGVVSPLAGNNRHLRRFSIYLKDCTIPL